MTTFGGRSQPILLSPGNGGSAGDGFGPSFTTSPFEMNDATITVTTVGPNNQLRFINTDSSLIDSNGVLVGGLPQQFGTAFPAAFPNPDPASGFPYKYRWVGDLGPDFPNSAFPIFNTFRDINTTIAVGFSLASGVAVVANVVIEGYSGDALTILARARYQLIFNRL